ncbi:helicase associated domain-containing protein [Streptomyces sp. NPDC005498]|uniref:helicase associated domain-containing protein n=1 Tax=Streptomyces sp. NPDC005498 TaxID=3364717 RepID=UPI0036D1D5AC
MTAKPSPNLSPHVSQEPTINSPLTSNKTPQPRPRPPTLTTTDTKPRDRTEGVLPDIQPGVLMDGDDLGRWLERQANAWAELSEEQQQRLTALGVKPAERPAAVPTPAAKGVGQASGKASAAFQRGVQALAQWVEREGRRPVPRRASEEITVDGEAEPVVVKLGVWVSNTRARRDKLSAEQLDALRDLGIEWA